MTPQLEAKVREIVAASKTPLDAAAIRRQMKGEFAIKAKEKQAFDQWLPSLGFVEWPAAKAGARYWTRTAEDVAEDAALAATTVAILPKKLITTITKGKSGYPKDRAEALIARLEDEGKLHRQPLLAESKYKLTSKLTEENREFLHKALRIVLRSFKALGEDVPQQPTPATTATAKPDDRILNTLAELEPQKGLLVTAQRLRHAVAGLSKQDFDDAVLRLYRSEKVLLHRHSGPFLLPAEERNELIQSGESFYVGVCWNTGEE